MKRKIFIALKESNQIVDYLDSVGVSGKTANDLIESIVAKGDHISELVLRKIKESPKETWDKLINGFSKYNNSL